MRMPYVEASLASSTIIIMVVLIKVLETSCLLFAMLPKTSGAATPTRGCSMYLVSYLIM